MLESVMQGRLLQTNPLSAIVRDDAGFRIIGLESLTYIEATSVPNQWNQNFRQLPGKIGLLEAMLTPLPGGTVLAQGS
ncbi:MAG: hypothetical protein ACLQGP_40125 [Isosphaeraceae bacterium]